MSRLALKNNNLTITDGTNDFTYTLSNYDNSQSITPSDDSYVYFGYKKPNHTLYVDIVTGNTEDNLILIEKYNGSSWETVDRIDNTNGLKESGFIYLEDFENEAVTTINGDELYWIRMSYVNANINAITFRWINLVFCDEKDLQEIDSNAKRYYPVEYNENGIAYEVETLLLSLIAGRNRVLSFINRFGKRKYVNNGVEARMFNQWDLHDIDEVRDATKEFAMAYNYENSTEGDDEMRKKANQALDRGYNILNRFENGYLLQLDTNDDGILNNEEKTSSVTSSFNRLGR